MVVLGLKEGRYLPTRWQGLLEPPFAAPTTRFATAKTAGNRVCNWQSQCVFTAEIFFGLCAIQD